MAATIFAACVVFLCAGLLWFNVLRPVLEDYGVIVADKDMSTSDDVPIYQENIAERRSYAVEQVTEQAGTGGAEHVPNIVIEIGTYSDEALLNILARVRDADGEYRFAESRIGRFIGGRLEDRIAQVRHARGVVEQPKPQGYITPIAGRPTKASYYDNPELEYQSPPV